MNILRTLVAVAALLPVIASAQTVNQRQREQHRRIVQGVRSGALTRHEARGLRVRESALRARERRDRFFHGGHLTLGERARLERTQNRIGRGIHEQRHDAPHRP